MNDQEIHEFARSYSEDSIKKHKNNTISSFVITIFAFLMMIITDERQKNRVEIRTELIIIFLVLSLIAFIGFVSFCVNLILLGLSWIFRIK